MLNNDREIILHPTYKKEVKKYTKAEDFHDGDRDVMAAKYLVKLAIEKKEYFHTKDDSGADTPFKNNFGLEQWRRRCELLDYFNHTAQVINIHLASVSAQSIEISNSDEEEIPLSDVMLEVVDDATGFDESLKEFLYEAASEYLLYGKVGVLVDSEAENASRPFLIKYKPQLILNWKVYKAGERKGQLEYITLEEEPEENKRRVRHIFINDAGRYSWVIYSEEKEGSNTFEIVDGGEGALDFIPFVVIGKGYKKSAIKDVLPISEIRMNRKSSQDNILHNQGFQRSTLFSENAQKDVINFVEGTIAYSTDPNGKFETIEPVDPSAHDKEVKTLDRLAFRIGLLEKHQQADDSRAQQSADSKAADNDILCEFLEGLVDLLVKKFNTILKHTTALAGSSDEPVLVISKDFKLADSQIEVTNRQVLYNQARGLGLDFVAKEVVKQGVVKTINDEDKANEINKQIDDTNTVKTIALTNEG